jgi:hypothetical protein
VLLRRRRMPQYVRALQLLLHLLVLSLLPMQARHGQPLQ